MDVKEVTFNDMPQIIGKIFQKIERVEQIQILKNIIRCMRRGTYILPA